MIHDLRIDHDLQIYHDLHGLQTDHDLPYLQIYHDLQVYNDLQIYRDLNDLQINLDLNDLQIDHDLNDLQRDDYLLRSMMYRKVMIYLISPTCAGGLSCLEGFPDGGQHGAEPPLVELPQILALNRKAQHSPLRCKDMPGTYKNWEGG